MVLKVYVCVFLELLKLQVIFVELLKPQDQLSSVLLYALEPALADIVSWREVDLGDVFKHCVT